MSEHDKNRLLSLSVMNEGGILFTPYAPYTYFNATQRTVHTQTTEAFFRFFFTPTEN